MKEAICKSNIDGETSGDRLQELCLAHIPNKDYMEQQKREGKVLRVLGSTGYITAEPIRAAWE